jgi:hypothetical protein
MTTPNDLSASALEPVGQTQPNGTYVLDTTAILKLNTFLWEGFLLDTTQDAYCRRINIPSIRPELTATVNRILGNYASVILWRVSQPALPLTIVLDQDPLR